MVINLGQVSTRRAVFVEVFHKLGKSILMHVYHLSTGQPQVGYAPQQYGAPPPQQQGYGPPPGPPGAGPQQGAPVAGGYITYEDNFYFEKPFFSFSLRDSSGNDCYSGVMAFGNLKEKK